MTEAEWLACTDADLMLEFLQGAGSDRKLRLFAVACCRRIWHLLNDDHCQWAVETAEKYADCQATDHELRAARFNIPRSCIAYYEASRSTVATTGMAGAIGVIAHSVAAVKLAASIAAGKAGMNWNDATDVGERAGHTELLEEIAILRDIFGNPFRSVTIAPSWLTPTVVALAQAAYDNRNLPAGTLDNDRLFVLADALEEAGCTDTHLLDHLRSPGPHVRGCWGVDLLLCRE